nr:MAG TPA: restriction endonuclease [Caudoviricetes sp.]
MSKKKQSQYRVCEVCGEEKHISDFSKSYKHRCKKCVARQTKEQRSQKKNLACKDNKQEIETTNNAFENEMRNLRNVGFGLLYKLKVSSVEEKVSYEVLRQAINEQYTSDIVEECANDYKEASKNLQIAFGLVAALNAELEALTFANQKLSRITQSQKDEKPSMKYLLQYFNPEEIIKYMEERWGIENPWITTQEEATKQ